MPDSNEERGGGEVAVAVFPGVFGVAGGCFRVSLSCPGGFRGQPRCRVQRTHCLYVWSDEKKKQIQQKVCSV